MDEMKHYIGYHSFFFALWGQKVWLLIFMAVFLFSPAVQELKWEKESLEHWETELVESHWEC